MPAVPALLAPRAWPAHLVVVAAVVAAGWLGLWQYHGWQDRRDAEARDLTHVAAVPLADAIGPDDAFPGSLIGQPVEVSGTWLPDTTLYVSGREHGGRAGYWVVGVVDVNGSLLPTVRGWSPSASGVPPSAGAADLVGWLQPSDGAESQDADPDDGVLPELRVADLAQRFDEDLYGAYVVVRDPDDAGLAQADLAQLPDAGRLTAIRNLLYAFEWWFFGGFAVFVWSRWARETVEESAASRTG